MPLRAVEPLPTVPVVIEPSPVCSGRIGWIGAAMIGLGLARGWTDGLRLTWYLVGYGRRVFDSPSSVPWPEFSGIAWAAWPVLLGIVLIWKRSPKLLKASAISGLALGVESAVSLVVGGLFDSGWSALYQGGYDRSLGRVLPHGPALGWVIASALAWFGLALVCFFLIPRRPRSIGVESFQEKRLRRRASARMANAGSTLFAASLFAMIVWTTFITSMERLPWVRSLILNMDSKKSRNRRPIVVTADMRKNREAERFLNEAQGLASGEKFAEARRAYIRAANRFEDLMEEHPTNKESYSRQFALAANNLAWFLATCPDETIRDAESAVMMAKKAVAARPNDGNSLNTLAVAQFRLGELDSALETFAKSMALRDGGDSFDWFFLAQIEAKKKRPEKAREWFDKAVEWAASYRLRDAELFRFQVETAKALGLPKPQNNPTEQPR